MKPAGCATLKKALGTKTTVRRPESTQPVTTCHLGIGGCAIRIAPGYVDLVRRLRGRPAHESFPPGDLYRPGPAVPRSTGPLTRHAIRATVARCAGLKHAS